MWNVNTRIHVHVRATARCFIFLKCANEQWPRFEISRTPLKRFKHERRARLTRAWVEFIASRREQLIMCESDTQRAATQRTLQLRRAARVALLPTEVLQIFSRRPPVCSWLFVQFDAKKVETAQLSAHARNVFIPVGFVRRIAGAISLKHQSP